jgi:hypothetical protein
MAATYYLDESGSSGDVIKTPGQLDSLRSDPIFVLACVRLDDPAAVNDEIEKLKRNHRVQAKELKSKFVWDKPKFVRDLFAFIQGIGLPVFIEVTEKRFLLCTNIVQWLVMPPVGDCDLSVEAFSIRSAFAEYLSLNAPATVFEAYVSACNQNSLQSSRLAFDALISWLQLIQYLGDVPYALLHATKISRCDFEKAASENEEAWKSCLPVPDSSKKGKPIWLLPNLSSFANIYARINRFHKRDIAPVTLIHDEHAHFDQIIEQGKLTAERLQSTGLSIPLLHSDFGFTQQADLVFRRSVDCIGIQVADVLAGFIMRYVQNKLDSESHLSDEHKAVFRQMLAFTGDGDGTGLNFVLDIKDTQKLDISFSFGF